MALHPLDPLPCAGVPHTNLSRANKKPHFIISGEDRLVSAGGVDGVAIRGELELHHGASVPAHH